MRTILSRLAIAGLCLTASMNAFAELPWGVELKNAERDTILINEQLERIAGIKDPSERVFEAGKFFWGKDYVAGTLEGEDELLRVSLDGVDCCTFVDLSTAMALSAGRRGLSYRDFLQQLEGLRYRGGRRTDYASRLHYISDWIMDNRMRGNLKELTGEYEHARFQERSLSFMSDHRKSYRSLQDSAMVEKIKHVEDGLANHRFPYIRTADLGRKDFAQMVKTGDLVGLVCNRKDLDVTHMGMIMKKEGVPYLVHASQSLGKVVVTEKPLVEFMKRNRNLIGIRVFRATD